MSNLAKLINKLKKLLRRQQVETSEVKLEFIPQNGSGLYLAMQKVGCFFRAACHMAEMQVGKALTVEQLNALWDLALSYKYINAEQNVQQSAPIATLALKALKGHGKFVEVATEQNGTRIYYPSVINQRSDYFIQKILQGGPSKTHFINVDGHGELLWDPHDPEIKKLSAYYTICYRFDEEKQ